MSNTRLLTRLERIATDIKLAENFRIIIGQDEEVPNGRFYFQVGCKRPDAITGEWGMGYGVGVISHLRPVILN